MTDDVFTEPDESREQWVDVRMTDPDEGEWDIDVVVAEGTVEFVDLRVRPELLTSFVECLVDDVDDDRAETILSTVAERNDLDITGD
jgi:hypothetical protein